MDNKRKMEDEIKSSNSGNSYKNISRILSIFLIIMAIAAAVCVVVFIDFDKDEKVIENDAEVKESAYRMSGNSVEDFDLYFLQQDNTNKNRVYSPLSIKFALQMLAEGSDGKTKAQLDAVIGDYKANKYVNNANMSFANALFIKDTFKDAVKENYKNTLSTKYSADIIIDPFTNPATLNSWVSDKTFKLITDLFDDSVSTFDFALVNALAIDMDWVTAIQASAGAKNSPSLYSVSYKHEKYGAHIEPLDTNYFNTIKFGDDKDVKVLKIGASINNYNIVKELGEDNIRKTVGDGYKQFLADGGCGNDPDVDTFLNTYIEEINSNYGRVDSSTDYLMHVDDDVKVFAKNLKEYDGVTLQYVAIMPNKISLEDYVKDINAKKINTIISNLKEIKSENFKQGVVTKIEGNIPVFNFNYDLDLMKSLKSLGITDAFDISKADLSKIANTDIAISKVAHKAAIEFSNEGIKAAAATMGGGMGAAGCWYDYLYDVPVETIDLSFNNPYMFLIRDVNSGEVWFAGTVYEPTTK